MINFSSFGMVRNPLFYVLLAIDVILKGISLYKSARRDQRVWFVALLIVNSMGILPFIYLVLNKDILVPMSTPTKPVKKSAHKGKK